MDELANYRQIIRRLIEEYARQRPSNGEIEIETFFDDEKDHYELMYAGWTGLYRIHGSVLHLDIRNGKIWIQYDGTPDGIAYALVEAGVPHEKIVLAFKHPSLRVHTEFAVA